MEQRWRKLDPAWILWPRIAEKEARELTDRIDVEATPTAVRRHSPQVTLS